MVLGCNRHELNILGFHTFTMDLSFLQETQVPPYCDLLGAKWILVGRQGPAWNGRVMSTQREQLLRLGK